MRTTKKDVVTRFENIKSVCKELEQYSIVDAGIGNLITICDSSNGTQNFYTTKAMNAFLDGILFLNRITITMYKRTISWTVNDFKRVAEDISDEYVFDENKYPLALRNMIDNHDSNVGINNDVIRMHLIEYCQID